MTRKFLQLQNQYLSGSGARVGDTTIILKSFKMIDGTNITDMASYFGDLAYATIEPDGPREEQISFTGITTNGDGTVSLTGVSSVNFNFPYTESAGLTKNHAGGSVFVISNTAAFYKDFITPQNDYNIEGKFSFEKYPEFTKDTDFNGTLDEPTLPGQLITKQFLDKRIEETEDLANTKVPISGNTTIGGNKTFSNPIAVGEATLPEHAVTKAELESVTIAGAGLASETQAGLVSFANTTEFNEGTDVDGSGRPLVVKPSDVLKVGLDYNPAREYNTGDIVKYNGVLYKSTVDDNNVAPDVTTPAPINHVTFDFNNGNTSDFLVSNPGNTISFYNNGLVAVRFQSGIVYSHFLSEAYNLNTVVSTTSFDFASGTIYSFDISEGRAIVVLQTGQTMRFYTITGFDVSTMVFSNGIASWISASSIKQIKIVSSTKIHYLTAGSIIERTLTAPWILSSSTQTFSYTVPIETDPLSFGYTDNGTYLYVSGNTFRRLRMSPLSTPYTPSTATGFTSTLLTEFETRNSYVSTDRSVIVFYNNNSPLTVFIKETRTWERVMSVGQLQTFSLGHSYDSSSPRIIVSPGVGFVIINSFDNDQDFDIKLNNTVIASFNDDSSGTNNNLTITIPVTYGDVITLGKSGTLISAWFRPLNI